LSGIFLVFQKDSRRALLAGMTALVYLVAAVIMPLFPDAVGPDETGLLPFFSRMCGQVDGVGSGGGQIRYDDGNKRTALATALVFLELNGISLSDPEEKLYDVMISLASGNIERARLAAIPRELKRTT
jgi:hypothetical protein